MSSDGTERCQCCRERVYSLRPVCIDGRDKPANMCALCYSTLDEAGRIDHERDAEVFGYAQ